MAQEVQYCTTADGVRIAYAVTGRGNPLLRALGWFTHLEREWQAPYWRYVSDQLSERFTLIRYDGRGMGLSDRDVKDFSLDAKVRDLEAVIDAAGLERCAAFAISEGGPTAVAYAAKHPDRLSHLVIYGSTPAFNQALETKEGREFVETMLNLARLGWGSDNPSYRQFFTGMFMPDAQGDAVRLFTEFQRASAPPENVVAMLQALFRYDVRELAPQVRVPTLVIHRRGDTVIPFEWGREFATLIPGARFLPLEGRNHVPQPEEPESATIIDAIERFVTAPAEASEKASAGLCTVLFTDLVGHTQMMSRLGDLRGREVLREHERITREVLKAHGGKEVKTMGDGFMASFGSVTRAVECAIALQRSVEDWNAGAGAQYAAPLRVRVGLNAGEPIEEDGDLFGATVILAARIAAKADGGEILVADTVRGLCAGKRFLFADRGEFVAKGFEEPVRLYEVRSGELTA